MIEQLKSEIFPKYSLIVFLTNPNKCVCAQLCPTLWRPRKNTGVGCQGSFWPRDWTGVSCVSWIGRQILYHWATKEAPVINHFLMCMHRRRAWCIEGWVFLLARKRMEGVSQDSSHLIQESTMMVESGPYWSQHRFLYHLLVSQRSHFLVQKWVGSRIWTLRIRLKNSIPLANILSQAYASYCAWRW